MYPSSARRARAQATRPTVQTEWVDERHDVPAVRDNFERAGCERWLRRLGFLAPGEDDAIWSTIQTKWVAFLSATSVIPTLALAPNEKAVQFCSKDGSGEEGTQERDKRYREDRTQRKAIQASFWTDAGLEGIEGLTERWPQVVRIAMNDADEGRQGQAFTTLAAVWDLGKRRRYQAVWTTLVGFLVYASEDGALEAMGLRLDEDQYDDILDVRQEVLNVDWRGPKRIEKLDGVWAATGQFLVKGIKRTGSTARNNPLVWWMAVLVRSAISDAGEDYISRGQFLSNPIPMDLDIRGRAEAMIHYGKILALYESFSSWMSGSGMELTVQADLNAVDNEWLNEEGGKRPGVEADNRTCSNEAWQTMVTRLREQIHRLFNERGQTAMYWIVTFERDIRTGGK